MKNELNTDLIKNDKNLTKQLIQNQGNLDRIRAERGWLGNIWGNSEHIPHNIAAFSVVLLLILGMIYTFLNYSAKPEDIAVSVLALWGVITPLITLCIGYLFGEVSAKNKEQL